MNLSSRQIEVAIEFSSKSVEMLYMPISGHITKVVQPGETEFLMHTIANPAADSFIKRCTVQYSTL